MENANVFRRRQPSYLLYIIASVAGLVALALSFASEWGYIRKGLNDFPAFYVAPRMLGTGELYDRAAFLAKENEILGRSNPNIVFIRFPYVAVMLAPLSHLPFSVAYILWQALSLAALAIFAALWPARRPLAFVICCWFPPMAANCANAQDVTYLLLWIALAAWLVTRGKDFGAGLTLSLCAAKPHLFLFLPVLIIARRMWKLGAGLVVGGVLLLTVSFLAAGTSWPAAFLQAIRDPAVHPAIAKASLVAFVAGFLHGPGLWVFVGIVMVLLGAIVYRVAQRTHFAMALAIAVAAGPIVAFHVYTQDYLLTLPLILSLVTNAKEGSGSKTPQITVTEAG
jgi:hypothetical protein